MIFLTESTNFCFICQNYVCNSHLTKCILLWVEKFLKSKITYFDQVWSRISRFSNELLETRQDQDFINKDLEKGKETRHSLLISKITKKICPN